MLGRAVTQFQPPVAKTKPTTNQLSSSPTPNIDALLKSKQMSQQSIGAFAGVRNRGMNPPQGIARPFQKGSSGQYPAPAATANLTARSSSVSKKRNSSEMSTGIAATLNSSGSFQDQPPTIDLTQDEPQLPRLPAKSSVKGPLPIEFDINDFDDDDDLDLDIEYPTGLPLSSNRKPLRTVSQNIPHNPSPVLPQNAFTPSSRLPQSSAVSWSSSPLNHKLPPPRNATRPESAEVLPSTAEEMAPEPSSEDIRPAKRRTVPWIRREQENRQPEIREEEALCFKCGKPGHVRSDCTNKAAACSQCGSTAHHVSGCDTLSTSATPMKRESTGIWNTTASAVKENLKAHRTKHKVTKQQQEEIMEEFSSLKPKPAPIFLSDEQKKVLSLVCDGKQSVFFTGSAGTGKSVLMRSIITELRKLHRREPDRVAVTASTGLAACNIGGVTLHSFSGIGLGKEDTASLVRKIQKNQKTKNRWLRTKVLIIDEISMVDGDLFDKLEGIARAVRKNGRPFGGIQLVITGDFFQLPPVPDYGKKSTFAFDANTWSTSINHTIGLTEVFRQRDPEFAEMLNEMRLGKISDHTIKRFRALDRPIKGGMTDATELFPTRAQVDNANSYRMRNLFGKSYVFRAQDTGTVQDIKQRDKLLANCMAPEILELKKGSQVMLIKNMDETLVNGSLGVVLGFMDSRRFEIWSEDQAIGGPREVEDLEEAKSTSGLNKFKANINLEKAGDTTKLYPLVDFELGDGTRRAVLVMPEDWKIELPNGEVQAQRHQVPLILAWALSIHKAQGQTLERVTVDLQKIFENGQAYVALSRATTQEGLWVKNFNKKAVMAHPRVAEFYDGLYSVNKALKNPKVAPPRQQAKPSTSIYKEEFAAAGIIDHTNDPYGDDEEAISAYG